MSAQYDQFCAEQKQVKLDARARKALAAKISEYALQGAESGCPQDQIANFLRAGVWLQPKQLEIAAACRMCDEPDGPKDIMAGGGRGAAKTHSILAVEFCDDCQRVPNLKVLVVRKVGRSNKEQIQDFRKKLLRLIPHNFREQQSTITFENGSMVILGNFKDEKDIDKYLGLEYDLIHIVESNQITITKKMNILSCLRTNKTNWRPRCYEDTNPGGTGHSHNKQIFILPHRLRQAVNMGTPLETAAHNVGLLMDEAKLILAKNETRYIHCTIDDNAFVDAGYKEYLQKLIGWQREAWLNGSWDFLAGAYFTNFNQETHVYPNRKNNFQHRSATEFFGSFDYGFGHNTAFLLFARDKEGVMYVIDEYVDNEKPPSEHAEAILGMLSEYGLVPSDLSSIVAGHDCFHRKEEGNTIAQTYSENGIDFSPSENARVNGFQRLLNCFGDVQTGTASTLFINRKCKNTIEQITTAQHHEKIAGDIQKFNCDENGDGGDDALDALRIGVFSNANKALKWCAPVHIGIHSGSGEAIEMMSTL